MNNKPNSINIAVLRYEAESVEQAQARGDKPQVPAMRHDYPHSVMGETIRKGIASVANVGGRSTGTLSGNVHKPTAAWAQNVLRKLKTSKARFELEITRYDSKGDVDAMGTMKLDDLCEYIIRNDGKRLPQVDWSIQPKMAGVAAIDRHEEQAGIF